LQPREPRSLSFLTRELETSETINFSDRPVTGIVFHSGSVSPGDAFVAIRGLKADGHQYIGQAIANGASAVFCEGREWMGKIGHPDIPVILVPDARRALSRLSATYYGHPCNEMLVCGVTGTNGKTTTTSLLDAFFRQAGFRTGLIGTLSRRINDRIFPAANTTPDSPEIHQLLSDMLRDGVTVVSMEVSSHALSHHRVDDVTFDVACITNFSPDHLDFHTEISDYRNSKRRLFEGISENGIAVVNADDDEAVIIGRGAPGPAITYGIESDAATIRAVEMVPGQDGSSFTLQARPPLPCVGSAEADPFEFRVKLSMPGKHNVYNALAASSCALALGLPPEKIRQGIENATGVHRRLQVVRSGQWTLIDDFAHNPGSLDAAFSVVSQRDFTKLISVYAIRGNRGEEINRANGEILGRWMRRLASSHLVVTRSSDTVEDKDRVSLQEEQAFLMGFREGNRRERSPLITATLKEALSQALLLVCPGAVILTLGAQGMDHCQELLTDLAAIGAIDSENFQSHPLPRPETRA